jgi:hypothetical protein
MMYEAGMLVLGMLVWLLGFAFIAWMSLFTLGVLMAIFSAIKKMIWS